MAQALRYLRNVQVINFGDCLVRTEGAIALAAVLTEGLPILKELNLSYGEITETAALVVAEAVMAKPHMEKVDLNGNCLGEEGCEALREAMENMDKGDILTSLSDDEGEPDEDDDDNDDDNSDECSDECSDHEDCEIVKENGVTGKDSPTRHPSSAEIVSFLNCPSAEKLIQLGEMRTNLYQEVETSDPNKAADVFLKIASLYSEETEIKTAVLDSTDTVLRRLLSGTTLQSYCFLSALLVRMGLLKGEGKMKMVPLVSGQLLCLEHAVKQDYFSQNHVSLLHTFISKNGEALRLCSSARERLSTALERKCHKQH